MSCCYDFPAPHPDYLTREGRNIMVGNPSSNDTSNKQQLHTNTIIQLSTLERTRRHMARRQVSVPRTARIASMITGLQLVFGRSFAGLMIVLLTLFYPVGAFAQETTTISDPTTPITSETQPSSSSTPSGTTPSIATPPATASQPQTPDKPNAPPPPAPKKKTGPKKPPPQPAAPKTGPQKPNGADADKYTYNEATGKWENGQYAWDPTTGQSQPMDTPNFSYNPQTNAWDTTDWRYDKAGGKYVPNSVAVSSPSDGNTIALDDNSTQFFSLYNNAAISNSVNSHAQSGDALVNGNTLAGNALTGDALTIANIFNMINSSASFGDGSEIATFSSDIYGNVYGDLYVDPASLSALQPASGIGATDSSIEVNADLKNNVANDIKLNAQSGNASVTHNTTAGNATSGSANAVANLVNMLNSAISSGGSFLGVLNIHGSLNGDILLPPGLLTALLASNSASAASNSSVNVNLSDTQSITNNVTTNAASGNANVSKNTQAGNATTGNGQTNVTILNLTGRNVVAANSLLVFVNVLGQWVGVIMDAPAGSTSAALGGGVSSNSINNLTANYNVNTESNIVNNVEVNAQSGNANVAGNTKAGNATSGNATASANIANITNSNFSLSGWFGVLFINVFGSWNGSFGVNTSAGNAPQAKSTKTGAVHPAAETEPKVFRFVPADNGGTTLAAVDMNNSASAAAVSQAVKDARKKIVAVASAKSSPTPPTEQASASSGASASLTKDAPDYTLPMLGFVFGGILLGGEQVVSRRQRRKLTF